MLMFDVGINVVVAYSRSITRTIINGEHVGAYPTDHL